MKLLKENWVSAAITVLVLIIGWQAYSSYSKKDSATNTSSSQEASVKSNHSDIILSVSSDITCSYPQILDANYTDNEITHELPKPERNPIIMTFSDILTEPKLRFIDSTQAISEVPVVKFSDTSEKLMFLEGTGNPYLTIHTIYKDLGVSTFTKQASLLGTPVATMSMGTCVNK